MIFHLKASSFPLSLQNTGLRFPTEIGEGGVGDLKAPSSLVTPDAQVRQDSWSRHLLPSSPISLLSLRP